jgi:NADH-quinone oxidoreductase subunit N
VENVLNSLNTEAGTLFLAILPSFLLALLAGAVLLLDVFLPESRRREIGLIAAAAMGAIALIALITPVPQDPGQQLVWGGMIRFDGLTQLFTVVTLVAAAIACLISLDVRYIGRRGEYYAVLIVATIGAVIMSGAADLIIVFLGLETLSISLYIMAGFLRNNPRSSEAGMKYFLFGAFTSTVMLYGMSLLYGFTGHTNLYAIGEVLAQRFATPNADPALILPILLAMIMIVVGFGFKISAVPFHFWTPDVYEGAPTPVTAYISVASKAASFALMARFFIIAFQGVQPTSFWVQVVAVMAVVTMTVGNLLALPQRNLKRLIAYSSIAQAGYTLIGVAAIAGQAGSEPGAGVAAVSYYMAMYVLTNLAAFGVIILFSNATGSENIADFAGLSRRNVGLALVLTVALLSLAGIPPAAGFIGKFFLFRAAVDSNLTWLAIAGVLNSIVALYYYLVVIKVMWVDRGADETKVIPVSNPYLWALLISTIAVIILGTLPGPVFDLAAQAARSLFS